MKIDFSFGDKFDAFWGEVKTRPCYQELATLDGIGEQTDMVKFSKNFFGKPKATADVSVDSNANVEDSSIIAYEVEVAKPLFRMNAYYLLYKYGRKLFDEKTAEDLCLSQFSKTVYINDFHKFAVSPYCFNFSALDVVFYGLPFVKKIKSEPPQHLSSFMGQMIQFVTYASNSVAGAVGLADLFICMSYFYDKEPNLDNCVKQELQSFIYSVNQPFRGGHQSAFTNVSLMDKVFLEKLCAEYVFPDGTHPKVETVQKIQRMYINMMNKTLRKTPCTFPVTTACFAVDDNREVIDKEFMREIVEANKEFGWINFYAGKTSTLSSCCRLRSEANHEYFNSFGAGGTKIGSMSVTTLNLPSLAYTSFNDEDFFSRLEGMVVRAGKINAIKRHIVETRVKNGNLPLYTLGFMDLRKQYSTCGLCGINEACEIMGHNILEADGQNFVRHLLTVVNEVNADLEKKFGYPHNCEQTPSENSAIKMAQADTILGINTNKYKLYSNQFIPLITKADMLDRVKLQGMFDKYMTGGAVLHLNIGERIENTQDMMLFLQQSIKMGVIYQAVNYVLNVCEDGHVSVGLEDTCPQCGKPIVDKLTRVVGFLTSVKNWHKVRREKDFPHRQFYHVK